MRFQEEARQTVVEKGVLTMPNFLSDEVLELIRQEGIGKCDKAYFKRNLHNVFLSLQDDSYAKNHAYNRQVESSKGCITDDVIAADSPLCFLYDSQDFKSFLCHVLLEEKLFQTPTHCHQLIYITQKKGKS